MRRSMPTLRALGRRGHRRLRRARRPGRARRRLPAQRHPQPLPHGGVVPLGGRRHRVAEDRSASRRRSSTPRACASACPRRCRASPAASSRPTTRASTRARSRGSSRGWREKQRGHRADGDRGRRLRLPRSPRRLGGHHARTLRGGDRGARRRRLVGGAWEAAGPRPAGGAGEGLQHHDPPPGGRVRRTTPCTCPRATPA